MITPAQCRAARALLNWTLPQLAEAAKVSVSTINSFELERRQPTAGNLSLIQSALEAVGVEFIDSDAPGVRLRPRRRK
jgi:transcriptional regulator with XRE-family HTH domain